MKDLSQQFLKDLLMLKSLILHHLFHQKSELDQQMNSQEKIQVLDAKLISSLNHQEQNEKVHVQMKHDLIVIFHVFALNLFCNQM